MSRSLSWGDPGDISISRIFIRQTEYTPTWRAAKISTLRMVDSSILGFVTVVFLLVGTGEFVNTGSFSRSRNSDEPSGLNNSGSPAASSSSARQPAATARWK